jgi:hypothetical protein
MAVVTSDSGDALPSRVALNARGDAAVVCMDEQDSVRVLKWNDCTRSLETLATAVHVGRALGVDWVDDVTFLTLATEPHYLRASMVDTDQDSCDEMSVLNVDYPFVTAMNAYATDQRIQLAKSIFERDEHGQLKMQKQEENRVQSTDRAWNDASRIDTVKARDRRSKKRRRHKRDRDVSVSGSDDEDEL